MSNRAKNLHHLSVFQVGEAAGPSSSWLIIMGIATVLLGLMALLATVEAALISILFMGTLFILTALFQSVVAVTSGRWTGIGLHLLLAVLYGVAGAFLIMNPAMAAATLSMLLAFFFFTSGLFRVVAATVMRFPGWGWSTLGGVVAAGLGAYVLINLPETSLVLLGTLVAVDLIFFGVTLTLLGVRFRNGSPVRARRLRQAYV